MNDTTAMVSSAVRPGGLSHRFHVYAAAACLVIAFVGFVPTFWLPLATGSFRQPFLLYLHGFLFTGWTVLFFVQAWLASSGRVAKHMELGLAGIAIAAVMLCVGILTMRHGVQMQSAAGHGQAAEAFSVVPFSSIVLFAALVAVAIAKRRDTDLHKRLMLVATASMLQPGIGRLFLLLVNPPDASAPPPVGVTIVPGLLANLIIVAGMIHDRRTRGRVHRAYWVAGGILLALQLLRLPLSKTDAWMAIAHWMAS